MYNFKMQVIAGRVARAANPSNHLALGYTLANSNKVLAVVRIQCLEAVAMVYNDVDAIAIARVAG